MSFILDALKKSEGERQRQSGPTIFEAKIAPPKSRLPVWALAIGGLLIVNLGVVAWLLMRKAPEPEDPPSAAVSSPVSSVPVQTQGATMASRVAPPPAMPMPPMAQRDYTVPDEESEPMLAEQESDDVRPLNPDDYEPAVEGPPPPPPPSSGVVRATETGLPTYQDVRAGSGSSIPELRLDLHVFAGKPEKRFIFLNMQKLAEGQSSKEGVHVDSITPTGAALSFQGRRFMLMRE